MCLANNAKLPKQEIHIQTRMHMLMIQLFVYELYIVVQFVPAEKRLSLGYICHECNTDTGPLLLQPLLYISSTEAKKA